MSTTRPDIPAEVMEMARGRHELGVADYHSAPQMIAEAYIAGQMAERALQMPSIMRAIQVVGEFLAEHYIVEECSANPVLGCMSCQAIDLRNKLAMLARDVMDDTPRHFQKSEA